MNALMLCVNATLLVLCEATVAAGYHHSWKAAFVLTVAMMICGTIMEYLNEKLNEVS